jgi:hypothetical protein
MGKEGVMPKEFVEDTMAPREEGEIPWRVEIGWQRDHGHVSIATVDPSVEGIGSRDSGLHVHLSERRQVNDLIRHLRRARDQAFGRDE